MAAGGQQRTDSTHVLAASPAVRRAGCARQTLRPALNLLAEVAPAWLRQPSQPEWVDRYDRHTDDAWHPGKKVAGDRLMAEVGADGATLLAAIFAPDAPAWLRELPAGETLRCVWIQNDVPTAEGVRWRTRAEGLPPSVRSISSPHDLEARSATQRSTAWIGDKVHLTETCTPEAPHRLTNVETTTASVVDGTRTPRIQARLPERGLRPSERLVDTGDVDAK